MRNSEWKIMRMEGTMRRGDDLKERTKRFDLQVIRMVEALPKRKTSEVIGRQLLLQSPRRVRTIAHPAKPSHRLILFR